MPIFKFEVKQHHGGIRVRVDRPFPPAIPNTGIMLRRVEAPEEGFTYQVTTQWSTEEMTRNTLESLATSGHLLTIWLTGLDHEQVDLLAERQRETLEAMGVSVQTSGKGPPILSAVVTERTELKLLNEICDVFETYHLADREIHHEEGPCWVLLLKKVE